ncbi:hypothetical protein A0H81_03660 [Grifola frondosa]|uniref:Uncharacterized protein n=1 Tax=Grifola frondosa TaxID=5627 RepID=A0A1C7MHL4_GRIFR|nr:hypothetical protein A0H81_03660 [Grifola frondosa]
MAESSTGPNTIIVRDPELPAFLLERSEQCFRSTDVILRHRYIHENNKKQKLAGPGRRNQVLRIERVADVHSAGTRSRRFLQQHCMSDFLEGTATGSAVVDQDHGPQAVDGYIPMAPESHVSAAIGPSPVRHERAIRGRLEKVIWFFSEGQDRIREPLPTYQARPGDLYVHDVRNTERQLWLRTESLEWLLVQPYHPHPTLVGYVLNLTPGGQPSWVRKETVRTYAARNVKRIRNGPNDIQ